MGFWRKTAIAGTVGTVGIGTVGGFVAMNSVAATNPGWSTFWSGGASAIGHVAGSIGHVIADVPGLVGTVMTGASHLGAHVMGGAFTTHLLGATAAASLGAAGAVIFPVAVAAIGLWGLKKVWDHFHKDKADPQVTAPEQQMQQEQSRGRGREREGPSMDQQQAMTRARGQVDNLGLPQNGGYNVGNGQTVTAPQGGYTRLPEAEQRLGMQQLRQPANVR